MLSLIVALLSVQREPPPAPPRPVAVPTPPPVYLPIAPPPPRSPFPAPPAPPSPPGPPRVPLVPLPQLVTSDDYPAAALRNNEQGVVTYRLTINGDGRVTNCMILISSGSAALDVATCRIMRARARFEPSADAGPAGGTHLARLSWRIVDEPPPAPNASRHWVQIAAGPSLEALQPELRRIRRRARAELEKYPVHSVADGDGVRLVVGPFETSAFAQTFAVALQLRSVGASAWTSAEGQAVEPLPEP